MHWLVDKMLGRETHRTPILSSPLGSMVLCLIIQCSPWRYYRPSLPRKMRTNFSYWYVVIVSVVAPPTSTPPSPTWNNQLQSLDVFMCTPRHRIGPILVKVNPCSPIPLVTVIWFKNKIILNWPNRSSVCLNYISPEVGLPNTRLLMKFKFQIDKSFLNISIYPIFHGTYLH